jgi:hypothetical protein
VHLGLKSSSVPAAAGRLRPWHCYSAAGAPAEANAITRLVPRRDNRRDRDVAIAIAPLAMLRD